MNEMNEIERLTEVIELATAEFASLREDLETTNQGLEDEKSSRSTQMKAVGFLAVLAVLIASFGFYLRHESCLRQVESRESLRLSLALIADHALGDNPSPEAQARVAAFNADVEELVPPIKCEFPE